MLESTADRAQSIAIRFMDAIQAAKKKQREYELAESKRKHSFLPSAPFNSEGFGCRESADLRRASMDLTRALADLRTGR